ncbi:MAG: MerR family transcriptional regulator [Myxococcota bacterium]
MPIGRFARSCRLSVKALRHYDELGLLAPAFVDPQSGYRYYAREQARDAVMISMLRSLDLPLAVIRRALAAEPTELKSLVDAEAARVEAELAAQQRALLSLRQIAKTGQLAPYAVQTETRSSHPVLRISGETDSERLVPDTTELVYALFDGFARAGSAVAEPVLCINEFGPDDRIAVHACVAFPDGASAPRVAGAEPWELPGGRFATVEHVGPYETLGLAHHALHAWAQERGHPARTTSGSRESTEIWEFYRNDPADVSPEELRTDVALPLLDDEV